MCVTGCIYYILVIIIGIGTILDFGLEFYLFCRRCQMSTLGISRICSGCICDRRSRFFTRSVQWRLWSGWYSCFVGIGNCLGIPCHVKKACQSGRILQAIVGGLMCSSLPSTIEAWQCWRRVLWWWFLWYQRWELEECRVERFVGPCRENVRD